MWHISLGVINEIRIPTSVPILWVMYVSHLNTHSTLDSFLPSKLIFKRQFIIATECSRTCRTFISSVTYKRFSNHAYHQTEKPLTPLPHTLSGRVVTGLYRFLLFAVDSMWGIMMGGKKNSGPFYQTTWMLLVINVIIIFVHCPRFNKKLQFTVGARAHCALLIVPDWVQSSRVWQKRHREWSVVHLAVCHWQVIFPKIFFDYLVY